MFYTATGEEFDPSEMDESVNFIGESTQFNVYLFYKPKLEYLRHEANLTAKAVDELPDDGSKMRLIFAPASYVDKTHLRKHNIKFVMLPFEIYKLQSVNS